MTPSCAVFLAAGVAMLAGAAQPVSTPQAGLVEPRREIAELRVR
jgi:hypothetical protein